MTRNEERATSALRGYFEPRLEQKQTCEKFVNDLELKVGTSCTGLIPCAVWPCGDRPKLSAIVSVTESNFG